jgi:hypothetical protein
VFLGIPSSFPLRVTSRILKIRRNIKNKAVKPSVYIRVHIQKKFDGFKNKNTFRETITLNNYVQEEIKGCETRVGWGGGGLKERPPSELLPGCAVCSLIAISTQPAVNNKGNLQINPRPVKEHCLS